MKKQLSDTMSNNNIETPKSKFNVTQELKNMEQKRNKDMEEMEKRYKLEIE